MTQDHEFSAVRKKSDAFVRQQQVLLRIGAGCAIAAPMVLAASFAPHGDLPTDVSTEAALRFVADHSAWLVIHLLTIVAALIWLGAFTALAGTLAWCPSPRWARRSSSSITVSTATPWGCSQTSGPPRRERSRWSWCNGPTCLYGC